MEHQDPNAKIRMSDFNGIAFSKFISFSFESLLVVFKLVAPETDEVNYRVKSIVVALPKIFQSI